MFGQIKAFQVIPGFLCNLNCDHCSVSSSPKNKTCLTENEILSIVSSLNKIEFEDLIITGGEPTLYIESINKILESLNNLDKLNIVITTNGWFAHPQSKNKISLIKTLKKVDSIVLSFDKYHYKGQELDYDKLFILKQFCEDNNIKLIVSVCVTTPLDLIEANNIEVKSGVRVIVQRIESCGRAKDKGVFFKFSSFDTGILDLCCPNSDSVSYIPGKGYSVCSNLAYNKQPSNIENQVFSKSIAEATTGKFFKEVVGKTFKQRLKENNITIKSLKNEHSSPCSLCEKIFNHNGDQ